MTAEAQLVYLYAERGSPKYELRRCAGLSVTWPKELQGSLRIEERELDLHSAHLLSAAPSRRTRRGTSQPANPPS